jgi:hypothetical protein
MAPEHAIGVYAVRFHVVTTSQLASCARPKLLRAVCWCAACCPGGGGFTQEPSSDIIVELCLRVALLGEPQYCPTAIDPLVQPRVKKNREPNATALSPRPAVGKSYELDVAHGHRDAPLDQPSIPAQFPGVLQADPRAPRLQAADRKQDERTPNGTTRKATSVATPSPTSAKTATGDAMLTPNHHAMDAAGVAKLRSMLAAAASPSPSGKERGGALPSKTVGDDASPTRSPGPRSGGLSAAEIQKMRSMLQQALASPTRT